MWPLCSPQYFASVISSLLAVAWIGQQVHNLFLTYLIGELVILSGLAFVLLNVFFHLIMPECVSIKRKHQRWNHSNPAVTRPDHHHHPVFFFQICFQNLSLFNTKCKYDYWGCWDLVTCVQLREGVNFWNLQWDFKAQSKMFDSDDLRCFQNVFCGFLQIRHESHNQKQEVIVVCQLQLSLFEIKTHDKVWILA